jgi:tRNA modification GTPase
MRVSGPLTADLLRRIAGQCPPPRRAVLRRLRDEAGEVLDRAIVLWFPGPASYTGEDSAELHVHGGRAVSAGVAEALASFGARPAEPGEFTMRAFLDGRMDLTEAEAVSDLVAAETAAQRRQALRQLDGALGTLYHGWAQRLRRLLAEQEALIDFSDEDLPEEVESGMLAELATLQAEVANHLDDDRRGERVREGLVITVAGAPNVGKSSLVNALAGRDAAIVSPLPGTTRDALETRIALGGVPVTLVDTAGLRETEDLIEAEGVRRARARASEADLVLMVSEVAARSVTSTEGRALNVVNKIDLGGEVPAGAIGVSALTGAGLGQLRARLEAEIATLTRAEGPPPLTRARHRAALLEVDENLRRARSADLPELRAEDLRRAMAGLGRITGTVGVEDILTTIFGQFCIGK